MAEGDQRENSQGNDRSEQKPQNLRKQLDAVERQKIKEFVVDGQVKFEDVEELGYEIKDFIRTSEEWCEGDLIYDFTTEAQQLLNNFNISSVGKNKD